MNVTLYDNLNQNIGFLTGGKVNLVRIAWPSFTDNTGNVVLGDNLTVPVTPGGICTCVLPSNSGTNPQVFYTFTFDVSPLSQPSRHEYYSALAIIPPSTGLVALADCTLSGAKWLVAIASLPAAIDTTLIGSMVIASFSVNDGSVYSVPQPLVIASVRPGQPVMVAADPELPPGVQVIGKLAAPDRVSLEFWNISGQTVTIPETTLSVAVKA